MPHIPKPYRNNDKHSFAHASVVQRWPAILNTAVADFRCDVPGTSENARAEAVQLIKQVEEIVRDMSKDALLIPLKEAIECPNARLYNEELKKLGTLRWSSAPWLLSECYLYSRLNSIFKLSTHWRTYDIFRQAKCNTFYNSSDAVSSLASRFQTIVKNLREQPATQKPQVLKKVLHELIMTALWGNATDLSLLVTISLEEIKKLQVAVNHRESDKMLVDDWESIWESLSAMKGGRVDFVLDNSGFELFTDVVLMLFLLESGLADHIVIHPKSEPWFVSDVTEADWRHLPEMLQDTGKFPKNREAIEFILRAVEKHESEGRLKLYYSEFWTTYAPFWEIKEESAFNVQSLLSELQKAKLVIFKGDLNYRKLTGDLMWPRTTPFVDAVLDLAHSGVTFAVLRTIKSDVVVGLPEGKEELLKKEYSQKNGNPAEWAWSGAYAVISCLRKDSSNY